MRSCCHDAHSFENHVPASCRWGGSGLPAACPSTGGSSLRPDEAFGVSGRQRGRRVRLAFGRGFALSHLADQGSDQQSLGHAQPWDMLNYGNSAAQWQVYIQATADDDFGGTALYMRKLIPWNDDQNYSDAEWAAEMQRINYPDGTSQPFQRGDLIRVDARAPGLFYNGKYNVNEQHVPRHERAHRLPLEPIWQLADRDPSLPGTERARGTLFSRLHERG